MQKRDGEEYIFQCLLVPAQLREDSTKVEVSISKSVLLLALPLQSQCILQTLKGCSEFAGLAVVAGLVIERDGEVLGVADGEGVGLLQEDESEVELVLLQEDHGNQVAQLAHLDGNAVELLALRPEVVAVELQDLLILVQSLAVLGLSLQLLALALQRLHPLAHGRVHRKYYIT